MADAYRSVGMEGLGNFYCYNGATPLLSAMLSVKYMLIENAEADSPFRTKVATQDGISLYENTYVLPLGFLVPQGLAEEWSYGGQEERVQNVNYLAQMLGSGEELMQQAGKLQPEGEESFFIAQTDGYYFAEHPNLSAGSVDVKTERDVTTFSKTTHNYFLDLGYLRAGERVTLHASDDKSVEGTVYKISEEAVKRSVDTLRANTMDIPASNWDGSVIRDELPPDMKVDYAWWDDPDDPGGTGVDHKSGRGSHGDGNVYECVLCDPADERIARDLTDLSVTGY